MPASIIDHLRLSLPHLPGEAAQYRMAPDHRQRLEVETLKVEQFRPSAVLVLFCQDESGEWFIPLIERMSYNGAHSAQISLPGGKRDESDESLMHTALRECEEEIGIKDVEVLGPLTKLFIPVSNFIVHPYVGVCTQKNPVLRLHEREVKNLVKLSVDRFQDEAIIERGTIEVFDNLKIKTPWFNVEGHKVWGATAMILSELREMIKTTS